MKTRITKLVVVAFVLFMGVSVSAATISLTGTIRDFYQSHPDMELPFSQYDLVTGIVGSTLGVDGKPVYYNNGNSLLPTLNTNNEIVVNGPGTFNEWYNDVLGINTSKPFSLILDNEFTSDPNVYTYLNNSFFPIDDMLFGNEGLDHNYHFTFELESEFTYSGSETFTFDGDDDVWVFINNQLVIDLGGVHPSETTFIDLDTLGLTVGNDYSFKLFFAERHTTESNFRMGTSIKFKDPAVPEPATMFLFLSSILGLFGFNFFKKK